jgi:hypothetical protein
MQEIGYLQSINSVKHLPHSLLTGKFFLMTTFCNDLYEAFLSKGLEPEPVFLNIYGAQGSI